MATDHDEGPAPDEDILPDELLDKHLGGSPGADDDPEPEADDTDEDEGLDDDASEDDDDEDPESEEEEEAGDEDPDEELDEDDGEDDEEDDEEEGEEEEEDEDAARSGKEPASLLDRVTPKDRERIENDPTLKKIHKQLLQDYTEKTQAVAADRKKLLDRVQRIDNFEQREQRVQRFEETLSTAEGMAGYIAKTFELHPEVIAGAFEAVATQKEADPLGFLVAVGLHDPETFEKAYERVQEFQSDPEAKKKYESDREGEAKSKRLDERERRLRRQQFDGDWKQLARRAQKEAARAGITKKSHVAKVTEALKQRLPGRVRPDGSINLASADVQAAVKQTKATLDELIAEAKADLNRETESKSRKAVKEKAKNAKQPKRQRPKDAARPRPKDKQRWKPGAGEDPLDAFVDHRLSG